MTTSGTQSWSNERFARPRSLRARVRAWMQPQVSGGRREQRDQALLLIAVAVVMVPHFPRLPAWASLVVTLFWLWRAWLTQSMRPGPGRIVTSLLLVGVTASIWIEYGTLFGRTASVELLLVLTALKVLEMRARRDVMVIVFLCLFVLLTQFLDDESLAAAALMVLSVWLLFLVLLSVNLTEEDVSFMAKARYVSGVFLKALPLTLVLFYFFPRLPSPMWISGEGDSGPSTGLSSSMSPGSIGRLLQSESVALRATFERGPPSPDALYWRGPVFGHFDGRTWTRLPSTEEPELLERRLLRVLPQSMFDYTVTLEATDRLGLLALDLPYEIDGVPTVGSRLSNELELRTAAPVVRRMRYSARSFTRFHVGPLAREASLEPWLDLPSGYDPLTVAWAGELTRAVDAQGGGGAARERRLADAVLAHFSNENFRYSLDPPRLGRDSVDEFLFRTRSGFCEHYAAAFVFTMRAMHVPARVVTGYQGGEINPLDGYFTVRQSDAHAWAEIWISGQGWTRVDPTGAVAPWRIERGSAAARAALAASRGRGEGWLHGWRLNREALENAWNQWFLSYSAERQKSLLTWIGIEPTIDRIAMAGAAVFCLMLAILAYFSLRHREERDPVADLVRRVRARLVRAGVPAPGHRGLADLRDAAHRGLEPASARQAEELLRALERVRYARMPPGKHALRDLRRMARAWRPVPLRRPASPAQ
jgi:transglutaminase-like putative cysteine protease